MVCIVEVLQQGVIDGNFEMRHRFLLFAGVYLRRVLDSLEISLVQREVA